MAFSSFYFEQNAEKLIKQQTFIFEIIINFKNNTNNTNKYIIFINEDAIHPNIASLNLFHSNFLFLSYTIFY